MLQNYMGKKEQLMSKFYLSYKNEDFSLAKELADQLASQGGDVVYDALALEPGSNWRDVLLRSIVNADAVIVLLTERALHSHFVMGEIGASRVLQYLTGKALLLPVLVGDFDIPSVVSDLFTVRMQPSESSIEETAKELLRAFGEHQARTKRGYPKIFISHRHNDASVVKALIDLLVASFEIEVKDLRCTSIPPYRLKVGDRTSDRLRAELQHAEAVLGIISPDVTTSNYVSFELGASWGRTGFTLPLLIRGATKADVPAPIGDLHTLSLVEPADCYQLIDDLSDIISLRRLEKKGELIEKLVIELVSIAKL
jgi:hypothetical protein